MAEHRWDQTIRGLLEACCTEESGGLEARLARVAGVLGRLPGVLAAAVILPDQPNAPEYLVGRWSDSPRHADWPSWPKDARPDHTPPAHCRRGTGDCIELLSAGHGLHELRIGVCSPRDTIGFFSLLGLESDLAALRGEASWLRTVADLLHSGWLADQSRRVLDTAVFSGARDGGNPLWPRVREIGAALSADYVLVGELERDRIDRVNTRCVYAAGEPAPDFSYDLPDTPCADVVGQAPCVYGSGVAARYPRDRLLADMGIEAYVGAPLTDPDGVVIGLLVALFKRPLAHPAHAVDLLAYHAPAAGVELQRLRDWRERNLLSEVVDQSRDGVVVFLQGERVLYRNAAANRLLGRPSPQTSKPEFLEDLVRGRLLEFAREYLAGTDAAGRRMDVLVELAGHPRDLSVQGATIAAGGERAQVLVLRDISERKAAERALRAERERTQLYWDNVGAILLVLDRRGIIQRMNRYACRVLGCDELDAIGTDWFASFLPPETAAELRPRFEAMVSNGDAVDSPIAVNENPVLTRRGQRRIIRWNNRVLLDADGGISEIVCAGEDVTELRAAEIELERSERRFAQVFHATPEAVTITDLDTGRLLEVNEAFVRQTGWTPVEALGRTLAELGASAVTGEGGGDLVQRLLRDGRVSDLPADLVRRDGAVRKVMVDAVLVELEGRPCYVAFARDVTDAVRLESERQELRAQLLQSQKMEAIGMLAGGIAHDFNNILAAILGFTELGLPLARKGPDGKLGRYLEEVHSAGLRARDLVAQLLAFSRARETESGAVQLAPVVKEVVRMLRSTLPTTLHLDLEVEDDRVYARANPVHVHQVLMNLTINARDALGGRGAIRIALDTGDEAAECDSCFLGFTGRYVRLSVADNGPGVEDAVRGRIFEPFFSTKEVGHGSGLGLSVVHGLAHAHGGHVRVSRSPDGGASFTVLWPLAEAPGNPAALSSDPGISARIGVRRVSGTVWIVDDEEAVGGFMREMLAVAGCTTRSFVSPEGMLEALENEPRVDVLVTDLTMPGMTGLDLAAAARARRPGLRVILCTGYGSSADPAALRNAGIGQLLDKPVTARRLIDAVAVAMAERRPEEA